MKMTISIRENAMRIMTGKGGSPEWLTDVGLASDVVFASPVAERPPLFQDGKDWFGCSWRWDMPSFGFAPDHRVPYLLDDVTEWESVVQFPDLEAVDWKAAAEKDLANYDRDAKPLRMFMESGPFERSHHLMGFETCLASMIEEPEAYKALIDRIADYKIGVLEKFAEFYQPDIAFFQDDLGTARGPFMSMEHYRALIKPAHKRIGKAMEELGIVYVHHSCGMMKDFIPDLIDNGVKGLNPIQGINDYEEIARKWGGKIYIEVGPEKSCGVEPISEEEIREEIRMLCDLYAPTGRFMPMLFFMDMQSAPERERIVRDEVAKWSREHYGVADPQVA